MKKLVLFAIFALTFFAASGLMAIKINDNLTVYGSARLDVIYNTTDMQLGDVFLYAKPENAVYSDRSGEKYSENPTLLFSPRFSRFGFKVHDISLTDNLKVRGGIEADFQGGYKGATAALAPQLGLRHAYAEMYSGKWSLLFGQYWSLNTFPLPSTVEQNEGLSTGNLWMRMPQIRFTYDAKPIKFAVSANRPWAGHNTSGNAVTTVDPITDGEYSGIPMFMGRLWFYNDILELSAYGHWSQPRAYDISGMAHDIMSYSAGASAVFNIGDKFQIIGKGFYGQDLKVFLGGVNQGIVQQANDVLPIASMGGFGVLKYKINDRFDLSAGYGMDDPDEAALEDEGIDLINDPETMNLRTRNSQMWLAGGMNLSSWRFMLGVSYLETEYGNNPALDNGKNIKIQLQSNYRF